MSCEEMPGFIKKILRHSFLRSTLIYTLGDTLSKAVPFLLLPIVAKYLTPSDFGTLTNFSVAVQVFTAICGMNTYTALTINYHGLKDDVAGYLSNLIYLILFLGVACLLIVGLFSFPISEYLGITLLWQVFAIITAVSTCIYTLYTSLLRIQERVYTFNVAQVLQSLLTGGLAILFVVFLQWNWQGRALSMIVSGVVVTLLIMWHLKKNSYIFSSIDMKEVRSAFSFGLPLLPHTLSFWFKSGIDKIIITNYISIAANGIYALALTFSAVIGVFTGAFFNAYAPHLYKDLLSIEQSEPSEKKRLKRKLVRITYLFSAALSLVALSGYFLLKLLIPLFFPAAYQESMVFLPMTMATLFFDGMYSIMSGYIFYKRKTKLLGIITFSSSVLQMALTFLLVQHIGIMGAAYSSLLVSVLTFVAVFIFANKLYDLPWGLKHVEKLQPLPPK
ncbi:oligosaccharide flippase family protein [Janthinobacterium sp. GW460P]|uniref:lipopolysaccharide biosynthesis protein n=1 Tax=unclassified Janthinobacterium TaxID=2610881 RepID=UPI00111C2FDF|nr:MULTISPECIES: oligosaccharide flippase family protein [unclassified Janthinobacterium]MCC7701851.1 oligosaccharide flippase family protein [Janthinobacterium sp. GW460P]MCC7707359.1 oligosaccharide flippase family protein [Janthinobacterium sp. GW460W]